MANQPLEKDHRPARCTRWSRPLSLTHYTALEAALYGTRGGNVTDYADRFLAGTYADDEPVCLTAFTRSRADRLKVSLPESLFVRAQAVATAYKLHLLPTIEIYAETSLNKQQCVTLLEEFRFIGKVVNDTLFCEHLKAIAEVRESCVNSSGPAGLLVEGP
jgi:hypothetical protein